MLYHSQTEQIHHVYITSCHLCWPHLLKHSPKQVKAAKDQIELIHVNFSICPNTCLSLKLLSSFQKIRYNPQRILTIELAKPGFLLHRAHLTQPSSHDSLLHSAKDNTEGTTVYNSKDKGWGIFRKSIVSFQYLQNNVYQYFILKLNLDIEIQMQD